MDKDRLIARLMTTFLGELEEYVQTLNRDLLALEKDAEGRERMERLQALFRVAHSLKGAARSVNVRLVEEACHRLETILAQVRDGQRPLDSELFTLLFALVDALDEAGMRLREQHDLSGSPLAALLPRLDSAVEEVELPPSLADHVPAPSASPAPARPSAVTEGPLARRRKGGNGKTASDTTAHAPPSPATPPVPPSPFPAPAERLSSGAAFVRVPAEKLDLLLARSGELLVARRRVEARARSLEALREFVGRWRASWRGVEKPLNAWLEPAGHGNAAPASELPRHLVEGLRRTGERLAQLERDLEGLASALASDVGQLDRAAGRLDEQVRHVRMLPFAEACQGLERTVRDVAQAGGKLVDLAIQGGTVELDRTILEGLKDPLNHLVRNAVDHGIELPERRRQGGKPPEGRIVVSATLRGSQVEVVVADDGRGLDWEALRRVAWQRGLIASADDRRDLTPLIFLPGVSTAPAVTSISGRGVGLDVVKTRLEQLHGTVDLTSTPGQGTRFVLVVPLTLTTLRALLVAAGGQVFAIATTNLLRLLRVRPEDFRHLGGRQVLTLGDAPLPVASLAEVLGLPTPQPAEASPARPCLILAAGERRMAFLVEEFLTEQEIVIKSLGARIRRVRNVAGATILPSGHIALVINAAHLVRTALEGTASASLAPPPVSEPGPPKPRLLVVDDSVTTRTLAQSILEAAGYDVATAADGATAWQWLQDRGADLVVTDIEMPRMDGFALTEAIRRSPRFADLPVILLTSRASELDRGRGVEVGADAYIVKSAFDQRDLLETIAQLL